jgi:hypothetical protein
LWQCQMPWTQCIWKKCNLIDSRQSCGDDTVFMLLIQKQQSSCKTRILRLQEEDEANRATTSKRFSILEEHIVKVSEQELVMNNWKRFI